MTIYDLKPAFQNLLRPLCNSLAKAGVTANQVTVAATLMSVLVGLIFALFPTSAWAALLIPVSLFVRMALNAIDGMLAREHNMQSDLGAFSTSWATSSRTPRSTCHLHWFPASRRPLS